MTRRALLPAVALLVALGTAPWSLSPGYTATHTAPSPEPAPVSSSAPVMTVDELATRLVVVDVLPDIPGYDRDCGTDKRTGARGGCVFGPAWTDDSAAPSSHNGCDTRNDVLAAQLTGVVFKPGTRDCKVTAGVLADPYTGTVIDFRSGAATSSAVQIDHVFPLSRAWDAGAADWPLDRRVAFANDTALNLLATDGATNEAKSDSGLDTWLPPNSAFRCDYATRYLTVAASYHLAVTTGDVDVARTVCASPTRQDGTR